MSDRTAEILKELIRTGARTAPPSAEPLVEGTSLHSEDVNLILGEFRARHRVDLIPTESPDALEEMRRTAGKGSAAAPAGRSSAVPTSAPEPGEEASPEDSAGSTSSTRKLRSRLAKLTADIARMEAKNAKKSGTK